MVNLENIQNIYQLIFAILIILIGSGGVLWKLIEVKNTKKSRKKLDEKLSKIDLIQNEKIEKILQGQETLEFQVKEIQLDVDNILVSFNFEENKKKIANEINQFVIYFIEKKQIENNDFKVLITNGGVMGIEVFNYMIDTGLKEVNTDNLETHIIGNFKRLRAGISIAKMGVGTDFKEYMKVNIMYPSMNEFINNFKIYQTALRNGKLYAAFKKIAIKMIKKIIVQSYNYYEKIRK